jgi:hypothetical protein
MRKNLEEIKFGDLTMVITTHSLLNPTRHKNHYSNIIVIVLKNGEELYKSYFTNGIKEVNKMKIIDQVNTTLLNKSLGLH